MNIEWYLARRLLRRDGRKSVSIPIVKIATGGIAAGLCVMLLSVFVITGFKQEITTKLSGFMAHLAVVPYVFTESEERESVKESGLLARRLQEIDGVGQAYAYTERPAIFKSRDEIHGVVTRGMDTTYNPVFFQSHLIAGRWPDFRGRKASNEILISGSVAAYLNVEPGDKITAHFVQEPPRARVFEVAGIYDTGFKEYDDVVVLVDRRHLTKLNGWMPDEASGVAVELKDARRLEEIWEKTDDAVYDLGGSYEVRTFRETAPQIFDWLNLLNMNVWVILILIVSVAGFNMVSGLLILILDKTTLIGLLKALGCRDVSLRRLFLYVALELIVRGMIWGNVVAFVLAGVQYFFGVVKLDPVTYYMSTVPVYFNWWLILALNASVIAVTVVMLIVPTMLVYRINPVKAIRYE